ncbi:hypothetical protein ACWC9T_33390 [Kitasatospora sp. NPDC001159]
MTTACPACPGCGAPGGVVPVPEALQDAAASLDGPTRTALAVRHEPRPGPPHTSAAVALLVVPAALWLLLGALSQPRPGPDS